MMASRIVAKDFRTLILSSAIFSAILKTVVNAYTSDGIISSPNYPDDYPNGYDGRWRLDVPPGYRIKMIFNDFNLEGGTDCPYDRLSFFDGPTDSYPLFGKYCGSILPPPFIITTSNKVLITFHTDGSQVRKGFKITHLRELNLKELVPATIESKLNQYFLNKKRHQNSLTGTWGTDITRVAVAMFLQDSRFFAPGNETGEEVAYELTLQLMSKLVTKKYVSTKDLALYANAMTVACINPKKFYGLSIVNELRKRVDKSDHINPFFFLTLCNAGDHMTTEDVQKLQELFEAQLRPSWTGTQAMIIMALKCISRKSQMNLESSLTNMVSQIKSKQQNNGTVENLKTTALVVQALIATANHEANFNISMAIKSIVKEIEKKNLGIKESYYIWPIIQWQSLVGINSNHCGNFIKTELEEAKDVNSVYKQIPIHISFIVGDDMDFSRTWKMNVSSTHTLYQVVESISSSDPEYNIQYAVLDGKPYISALGNFEECIEDGLFWFIFTKPLLSNDYPVLVEKSPVDIEINENDEYILWYRSEWSRAQNGIESIWPAVEEGSGYL